MSYIRKKRIEKDGAEFVIAPLTIEQVEQMIAPLDELQEKKTALAQVYDLVCAGLNNATPGVIVDDPDTWTPERVRRQLDQVTLAWLQEQILDFSGLRIAKDTPAGESSAAAPVTAIS